MADGAALPATVAVVDGICMGFGLGLALHADVQVLTENANCAMPENLIGLWPDVGFAAAVAEAPGSAGVFAALTGRRLTAADLAYLRPGAGPAAGQGPSTRDGGPRLQLPTTKSCLLGDHPRGHPLGKDLRRRVPQRRHRERRTPE